MLHYFKSYKLARYVYQEFSHRYFIEIDYGGNKDRMAGSSCLLTFYENGSIKIFNMDEGLLKKVTLKNYIFGKEHY